MPIIGRRDLRLERERTPLPGDADDEADGEADEDHDDQRGAERAEHPVDLDLAGVQDRERGDQPARDEHREQARELARASARRRPGLPAARPWSAMRGSVYRPARFAGVAGCADVACAAGDRARRARRAGAGVRRARQLELTLVPGAGMVGAALRQDGRDLLHRGDGLTGWIDRGATFGIPLLHPWANRLERLSYEACGRHVLLDPERMPVTFDGGGLPIHGLLHASPALGGRSARTRTAARAGRQRPLRRGGGSRRSSPASRSRTRSTWRSRCARTSLTFELTLTATGDVAVPVSFGWHPYLRLPGVPRAGVGDPRCRSCARGCSTRASIPTGQTRPAPFRDGPARRPRLRRPLPAARHARRSSSPPAGGGALRVRFDEGYPCAQVYTPAGRGLHLLRADDGADRRAAPRRRTRCRVVAARRRATRRAGRCSSRAGPGA